MAPHGGTTSRQKRTARRATTRANTVTAAATGSTSLPLSDRDTPWDAGAAKKSLSAVQFPKAFFWRDADKPADQITSYKLPFATAEGGTLTAVWKGVTAVAGALSGARGGVQIPDADVAGVKAKVASYYAKAAKKFNDPGIKPPWSGDGKNAAELLAYAELGERDDGGDMLAIHTIAWELALHPEFQHSTTCECKHSLSDHVGAGGPCTHEDGRGVCSCGAFAEMTITASERQRRTLAILTAAGVDDPLDTTYDLAKGTLGERRFYAETILAGFTETRYAEWPCDAILQEHGEALYRDETEAVYRLEDGTLAYLISRHGWFRTLLAGATRTALAQNITAFAQTYPALYRDQPDEDRTIVPITFWTNTPYGPQSRMRMIESAAWDDIRGNYAESAREKLEQLMSDDFEPGKDGQLILWQGDPGSGKTWALRSLATQWRGFAEFHYITDPDAFFVANPVYMIDVLLSDTYVEYLAPSVTGEDAELVTSSRPDEKWKVLILEDTGELLAANAKEAYGQGLSRLLNVVDGMVGQGLRVLAIVTTNDELGDLHPAAVRPGRCASQIAFGPLSAEEASAWAGETVEAEMTLAELYAEYGEPAAAFQDMGECADCGHMADQHADGTGACSVEGCDCAEYQQMETSEDAEELAASGPLPRIFPTSGTATNVTNVWVDSPDATLPVEHQPGETLPTPHPTPAPPEPVANGAEKRWQAVLVPEGIPTDDGRMFAEGAITWRELPLSLAAMLETAGGHDGAEVCGRIDRIWREGSLVMGEGIFDDSDFGNEIARMVDERVLRGLSVDVAIRAYEVTYDEQDQATYVVTDGVIGMATVCPFPAFAEANIALVAAAEDRAETWVYQHQGGIVVTADEKSEDEMLADVVALAASPLPDIGNEAVVKVKVADVDIDQLVAAAGLEGDAAEMAAKALRASLAPVTPPAAWFDSPDLEELTPLIITPEGRVYGHLAPWNECHIGIADVCTTAPHSPLDYSYFHLGQIECDDGELVAIGKITLGTGHADPRLGFRAAIDHYDDTGTVVADVRAGEDEHGIWIAGALRPTVDATGVRELRAAQLSGDWRRIDGHLEMVAALAVNVPGFPVQQPRALVAGGQLFTLIAVGVHDGKPPEDAFVVDQETLEKIAALAASDELEALVAEAEA